MADLKQIAETLVNLTVKEVNELATILKDEYGIEPAAAAAVMVAGGAAGAGEAAEEKTEFDVILKACGPNKLAVVNNPSCLLLSASSKASSTPAANFFNSWPIASTATSTFCSDSTSSSMSFSFISILFYPTFCLFLIFYIAMG